MEERGGEGTRGEEETDKIGETNNNQCKQTLNATLFFLHLLSSELTARNSDSDSD